MLLGSRDFGAIAVVNAIMFATANGSRSVLMPLLAHQSFGLTPTMLGALDNAPHASPMGASNSSLFNGWMAEGRLTCSTPAKIVHDSTSRSHTLCTWSSGLKGSSSHVCSGSNRVSS